MQEPVELQFCQTLEIIHIVSKVSAENRKTGFFYMHIVNILLWMDICVCSITTNMPTKSYTGLDDILLLYKRKNRQIKQLHQYINKLHPKLMFCTINCREQYFRDITMTKTGSKHIYNAYRKSTTRTIIKHNTSNHPHNMSTQHSIPSTDSSTYLWTWMIITLNLKKI